MLKLKSSSSFFPCLRISFYFRFSTVAALKTGPSQFTSCCSSSQITKVGVAFTRLAAGSKSAEGIIALPWLQQTGNARRQVPLQAGLGLGLGSFCFSLLFVFASVFPPAPTTVKSLSSEPRGRRQRPPLLLPLLSLFEMPQQGKHPQEHCCCV